MTKKKIIPYKCYNCGSLRVTVKVEGMYSCEVCARPRKNDGLDDENWTARALCRKVSLDFFSENPIDIRMAKLICTECPVKDTCLQEAISRREMHGVWGGTGESERHQMFRRLPPRASVR
jgi:WhiB family redox-sensing transcriptional regulator